MLSMSVIQYWFMLVNAFLTQLCLLLLFFRVVGLVSHTVRTKAGYVLCSKGIVEDHFKQIIDMCVFCFHALHERITDQSNCWIRPCTLLADFRSTCQWLESLFGNVLIPDCKYYSDALNIIDPATGDTFETVVILDGEECVDRELMDPKVFEDLDVAKISVLKNRPSVSHFDNDQNL